MRTRYFVTYDITDDDRRALVFRTLRGYGDHLQYSVFRCDLSDRERISMIAALHPLIDHREDQILLIDAGPLDGRAATCVSAIGRAYIDPVRGAVVI